MNRTSSTISKDNDSILLTRSNKTELNLVGLGPKIDNNMFQLSYKDNYN